MVFDFTPIFPDLHEALARSAHGFHRSDPEAQSPGAKIIISKKKKKKKIILIGVLSFDHLPMQGFGAGNFKALFECIELDQATRGNL